MARANFVKKARKAIPSAGIAVGDSYWWWKFAYGSKQVSKTKPTASQLTQSEFLSQIYDIGDRLAVIGGDASDPEDLKSEVEDIISDLETLRDEQEEKRNNMPDHLQDVGSGEMLQNRYDSVQEMIDELEAVDLDDYDEPQEDDLRQEALRDLYNIDDEDEADEEEKAEINETDVTEKIEELRQEAFDSWKDDKISELSSITYNGE